MQAVQAERKDDELASLNLWVWRPLKGLETLPVQIKIKKIPRSDDSWTLLRV